MLQVLQNSQEPSEVKMILNSIRWKYTGKDHGPIKHLEVFRVIYDGNQDDSKSLIS